MINFENLQKNGLITVRPNEDNTLFIANYTPKVQYERLWTEELKQCRGLIFNTEGKIVARPFPKFFNLEEHSPEEIPNEPFDVYEKLDGSLGILYFQNGLPKIATRGSFVSEQAIKANELLGHIGFVYNQNYTYLFEIIYPENRIVCHYGAEEKLILLAMIHTETGEEADIDTSSFPNKVKRYNGIKSVNELKALEEPNKEGFVVRFKSGFRVKVKFEEYVRLHRIITQVSNKVIWEYLKDKKPFDELLERVPDEFYDFVKNTKCELEGKFASIYQDTKSRYDSRNPEWDRKEFAAFAKNQKHPGLLFNLYDGKSIDESIYRLIKPAYEKPFRTEI